MIRWPTLSRASGAVVLIAVLLAGCAAVRPGAETPAGSPASVARVEPGDYLPTQGLDVASIGELRAAPPPTLAEVNLGSRILSDEQKLVAKSYVRIGTGCYPTDDEAARGWALRKGSATGADRILIYPAGNDVKAAATRASDFQTACNLDAAARNSALPEFVAVFYVRYKLPFGAQFRSLTDAQKQSLGVAGGVQIGDVIGGTPAADANLRTGDFVLKFNGAPVQDLKAFQEQLRTHMGRRVTLTVNRDGAEFERLVRLGVLATESKSRP